jgi:hypothetical protein
MFAWWKICSLHGEHATAVGCLISDDEADDDKHG